MAKPEGPVFDSAWRARSTVAPITRAEAEPMVRAHYLRGWPGVVTLLLGLYIDGAPRGVVVFALPPRETSRRYGGPTWELARLFVEDGVPTNAETYFMAKAVKYVRRHRSDVAVLVSYADPSAGHAGTIYKAANWSPDGRTDQERKTPRFDYADAATGKKYSRRGHVPAHVEIIRVPRISKHRFMMRLR